MSLSNFGKEFIKRITITTTILFSVSSSNASVLVNYGTDITQQMYTGKIENSCKIKSGYMKVNIYKIESLSNKRFYIFRLNYQPSSYEPAFIGVKILSKKEIENFINKFYLSNKGYFLFVFKTGLVIECYPDGNTLFGKINSDCRITYGFVIKANNVSNVVSNYSWIVNENFILDIYKCFRKLLKSF